MAAYAEAARRRVHIMTIHFSLHDVTVLRYEQKSDFLRSYNAVLSLAVHLAGVSKWL